jgi:copper(I)-binding protein
MRAFFGLVAAVALAGCQQGQQETTVDGAWVRLPAVSTNPGAAYLTLHGGSQADALVAVSAPFAVRTELHQSMAAEGGGHGMMTMKPVETLPVPVATKVELKPGGYHVMLYDVAPRVKAGEKAPLTLSFASGKTIEVQAILVAAGDPAPK